MPAAAWKARPIGPHCGQCDDGSSIGGTKGFARSLDPNLSHELSARLDLCDFVAQSSFKTKARARNQASLQRFNSYFCLVRT